MKKFADQEWIDIKFSIGDPSTYDAKPKLNQSRVNLILL